MSKTVNTEYDMKFELNDYHRNVSDSKLIEDLKCVADFIKKKTVTLDEYNEYGRFHATTLTRRFGSWFKCLELFYQQGAFGGLFFW